MLDINLRNHQTILITGGTSGLGKELVKSFLERGFFVIATGRQPIEFPDFKSRFKFYYADFSDLIHTSDVIKQICESYKPEYVINNAGILSPAEFINTKDGNELTFQVNFLAHFLVNEIIINRKTPGEPLRIGATTSPVYRLPDIKVTTRWNIADYKSLNAYSCSKLYLALMCKYLSVRYGDKGVKCFSFDPGVFGSGIYRTRSLFFHTIYHIALPFMRHPSVVASVMSETITDEKFIAGGVYDIRNRIRQLKEPDKIVMEEFWTKCYEMIDPFLK